MKLLNKPPFKRGDVVRCVLPYSATELPAGEYTVRQIVRRYGAWIVDVGDEWGLGWDSIRFVKVSEENSSETAQCSSGQAGAEV